MKRLAIGLALLFVVGCASPHHKVTDTASGTVYYAKKIHKKKGGTITFTDAKTGAKVTLTSSSVTKISGKEYKTAIGKK